MTQKHDEYTLECLKRIESDLSGNRINAKSDLLKAFNNPMNWCTTEDVPDHLINMFLEINNLISSKEPYKSENSFIRSINSLDHNTCEIIVSDMKQFITQYEIYVLRNRK